jgi:hypothetical protein
MKVLIGEEKTKKVMNDSAYLCKQALVHLIAIPMEG